jgi:hypothetical protein
MYAKFLRVRSDTKDGITQRLLYLIGVVCTPVIDAGAEIVRLSDK